MAVVRTCAAAFHTLQLHTGGAESADGPGASSPHPASLNHIKKWNFVGHKLSISEESVGGQSRVPVSML